MSTSTTNNSSSLTADQSDTQIPSLREPILTAITYKQLTEFHLKRRGVDKDGNKRPQQSLDNEESIIGDWISHQKRSPSDTVGEELGVRYATCLSDYLSDLEERELSKQTVRDRKSVVKQLFQSFIELRRTSGLPEDFSGVLKELVKMSGISLRELSRKTGISLSALRSWMKGTRMPTPNSLTYVRKLERALRVAPGTLSSRLPDIHWIKEPRRSCKTSWRSHQSKMCKLKYRLPKFPDQVQEEWGELVLFHTDANWARAHGLITNSEWRVRWNNNRCATADIIHGHLRSFFGYLCLPVEASDKKMAGLGFCAQELTLAFLTDADIVVSYLYFMKGRTVSESFNSMTVSFLSLCMMLTRNETGYLHQRPEFGAKLRHPIAISEWSQWCEENRTKMKEFKKEISKGKKDKNGKKNYVRPTRNSFEPVIDIIRGRQHPITALFDLASRLESLSPLLERGSEELLAIHYRSMFQVRLISSNPLRSENFSMMTHIPQSQRSFDLACELFRRYRQEKRTPDYSKLYVETTGDSNLYQNRDGSWRLRFNERDFKNDKGTDIEPGVRHGQYDVAVVPSVWPALTEYLFRYRVVLNEAIRNTIQQVRAKRGLSALTPEDEFEILRCRYVFRPGSSGINNLSKELLTVRYGAGQMSARTFSDQILTLTSRYLPESKGFCAHACRHLVATEYIKNHPDGWEVAAVALHNTAAMVRKHYAWVEVGDLIKPWSDYHEQLKLKHDRGEI